MKRERHADLRRINILLNPSAPSVCGRSSFSRTAFPCLCLSAASTDLMHSLHRRSSCCGALLQALPLLERERLASAGMMPCIMLVSALLSHVVPPPLLCCCCTVCDCVHRLRAYLSSLLLLSHPNPGLFRSFSLSSLPS